MEGGNKMKVYDILTPFNRSQTHSVVAESIAKAEEIFLKKYPGTEILEIRLHSDYVEIQKEPPIIPTCTG